MLVSALRLCLSALMIVDACGQAGGLKALVDDAMLASIALPRQHDLWVMQRP
jgi:hypothetical protein